MKMYIICWYDKVVEIKWKTLFFIRKLKYNSNRNVYVDVIHSLLIICLKEIGCSTLDREIKVFLSEFSHRQIKRCSFKMIYEN